MKEVKWIEIDPKNLPQIKVLWTKSTGKFPGVNGYSHLNLDKETGVVYSYDWGTRHEPTHYIDVNDIDF